MATSPVSVAGHKMQHLGGLTSGLISISHEKAGLSGMALGGGRAPAPVWEGNGSSSSSAQVELLVLSHLQ